jgi:alkylhydroperoxidase family enzyme
MAPELRVGYVSKEKAMSAHSNTRSLELVDPETASQPIADAFALLPVINVFRAMANAETLYPYFSNYLLRLFQPLELDKALERMIVLRVANQSGCFYAWRQNVVVAHSVGVKDEQIAALEEGDVKASCFTEAEQVAFTFTDEVMQLIEATDQTYNAAKKHFSAGAISWSAIATPTRSVARRIVRRPRQGKSAAAPTDLPARRRAKSEGARCRREV